MLKRLTAISDFVDRWLRSALVVLSVVLLAVVLAELAQGIWVGGLVGRHDAPIRISRGGELASILFAWFVFLSLHGLVREDAELRSAVPKFANNAGRSLAITREVLVWVAVAVLFAGGIVAACAFSGGSDQTGVPWGGAPALFWSMPVGLAPVLLHKTVCVLRCLADTSAEAGRSEPKRNAG